MSQTWLAVYPLWTRNCRSRRESRRLATVAPWASSVILGRLLDRAAATVYRYLSCESQIFLSQSTLHTPLGCHFRLTDCAWGVSRARRQTRPSGHRRGSTPTRGGRTPEPFLPGRRRPASAPIRRPARPACR